MALQVSSPAFEHGSPIPRKYTCDGENVSPPIDWHDVPDESKSLAVICDDPDAPSGTFTHWVLYNIPSSMRRLEEHRGDHPSSGTLGVNSFGTHAFGGPCPPHKDRAHHYHFHVYALDVESLGPAGLSKEDALQKMRGHIMAEGELVGVYKRASA